MCVKQPDHVNLVSRSVVSIPDDEREFAEQRLSELDAAHDDDDPELRKVGNQRLELAKFNTETPQAEEIRRVLQPIDLSLDVARERLTSNEKCGHSSFAFPGG